MTINAATGVVTWFYPEPADTPHLITIRATNGAGSGTETWHVMYYGGGDMDQDGDVDLIDFLTFAGCFAGGGITTPPASCTPDELECSDLDGDGDVDLADFVTFANSFTG